LKDKECLGQPKKFEDAELQAILHPSDIYFDVLSPKEIKTLDYNLVSVTQFRCLRLR